MKIKLSLICMALISLIFIAACSSSAERVEAKPQKPYEMYVHEDSDGCKYLIVRERHSTGQGIGIGLGITAKVNQPESCGK